ncbi:hypothetical protein KP509_13G098200 [Ceratopteris richardii]|uniref:Uncharacterized protein n=1 Tax=Ceratopteris richardii TaxID=49495 RepID=A0A8T2TIA3_CERRI|nr:hypothetical protein KP509_13G098200 [Ceratopteris richardii]
MRPVSGRHALMTGKKQSKFSVLLQLPICGKLKDSFVVKHAIIPHILSCATVAIIQVAWHTFITFDHERK